MSECARVNWISRDIGSKVLELWDCKPVEFKPGKFDVTDIKSYPVFLPLHVCDLEPGTCRKVSRMQIQTEATHQ